MNKASDVVRAAAQLISQGKWDGVSVTAARQINTIFEDLAALMNELEASDATVVIEDDNDE